MDPLHEVYPTSVSARQRDQGKMGEKASGGMGVGETAAATICGAVVGAGILFAIAEIWARGAVEAKGMVPLAYVLAAIGTLCGACVVLAYLHSDHTRTSGELSQTALGAEDYTLGPAPLTPMAWYPIPSAGPSASASPTKAAAEVGHPARVRRRPRRGHVARSSGRRAFHSGRVPQRPPAEA